MGVNDTLLSDANMYMCTAVASLSPRHHEVLKGALIGSGTFRPSKTKGVAIRFEQSESNVGYLERLQEEFSGYTSPIVTTNRKPDSRTGNTYMSSRLTISTSPFITPIFKE
jgi:hypothetical protein